MVHGSLFSGIGGFDLAAEWMGWENAFHCEIGEFGRRVLNYYWPNAISYENIKETDFTIWRGRIDILTGGFPCQPYSTAGKRLGKEDERHLWPEMLKSIRQIRPRYVVGENVSGIISWNEGLVFDEVQTDLENEGYEVWPVVLPACGVNAPHRRDRVWFVAYADNSRNEQYTGSKKETEGIQGINRKERFLRNTFRVPANAPNSNSQLPQERTQDRIQQDTTKEGTGMDNRTKRHGDFGNVADTNCKRLERGEGEGYRTDRKWSSDPEIEFIGCSERKMRTDWQNFPTQPPVCSGDDGLPAELDGITFSKWRRESIKAYGNAIVPQVAYQIFKAIEETEKM